MPNKKALVVKTSRVDPARLFDDLSKDQLMSVRFGVASSPDRYYEDGRRNGLQFDAERAVPGIGSCLRGA